MEPSKEMPVNEEQSEGRAVPLVRPWKCAKCGRMLGMMFGRGQVTAADHTLEVKCERCGAKNLLDEAE